MLILLDVELKEILNLYVIFNAITIKIPMAFFFTEIEKNPKFYIEPQKTLHSQCSLKKGNKAGGITLPDFRKY